MFHQHLNAYLALSNKETHATKSSTRQNEIEKRALVLWGSLK